MSRMSFYQYLMTERNPNSHDEIAKFANDAFYDQAFPKNSDDYDEISRYLELNAGYLHSMTIFDNSWANYQEKLS
ncbi:YozE family protein [Ligilactobacillus hayakitensis]|nr:YozE family protein [Ligilactobacillus hayakitensis]